ncbi:MAG: phosphatase PAP2 family protein [Burkholderiales bacterium]|nr:MAG: phosphatase PAP2 family protein [Burkholderiales bacterium]
MSYPFDRFIERKVVLAFSFLCALTWLLVKLTSEVIEGDALRVDQIIVQALRHADNTPIGPPALVDIARDITALGSPIVLSLLVIVTTVGLRLAQQQLMAGAVLVSSMSGFGATLLMKTAIARGRPAAAYRLIEVSGMGFPSGHAMMSSVIYLTLAILVAKASREVRIKLFVLSVAMTLAGLVGLSRVYLGVHWFTDVVGGWVAGAVWALACWIGVDRLSQGVQS